MPVSKLLAAGVCITSLLAGTASAATFFGGIAAEDALQIVERDMGFAAQTSIKINDRDQQLGEFGPIKLGDQDFVLLQLSDDSTLLFNQADFQAVVFDRKTQQSLNAILVKNEVAHAGTVTVALKADGFVSFEGVLPATEGKPQQSLKAKLHKAVFDRGNSELRVQDKKFVLDGTLGTMTYKQLHDAIKTNPEIRELVLGNISGSVNDEINMHTGLLVRQAGLTTRVLPDSDINSGGVDLFTAGVNRIVHTGAKVGVHSWCCVEDKTAAELPQDHPAHADQLRYFTETLGDPLGRQFYFYTLNAAPFDGIHLMSESDLKRFNVATEIDPVPLPSAGLMLLPAVGALAAARRLLKKPN